VDEVLQAAVIVGMFILRLGVPLAITLAAGYWLRRMDAKWEAEALARQAEDTLAQQEGDVESMIEMLKVIEQPCWILNECPKSAFIQCPAYQYSDIPCWLARRRVEGRLPQMCYRCELFTAAKITRHPQPVNW
jgi:hypothetical protein